MSGPYDQDAPSEPQGEPEEPFGDEGAGPEPEEVEDP